jgi:ribosomal protein L18
MDPWNVVHSSARVKSLGTLARLVTVVVADTPSADAVMVATPGAPATSFPVESTLMTVGDEGMNGTKSERALAVGKQVAEKAKAAGIAKVVFDRAGYQYHGRVKAVADGAREGGLEF